MKKIISLILAVLMLITALPMAASATSALYFGYRVYGDGSSVFDGTEITGFSSSTLNPEHIDIPDKMSGGKVLSIADSAFKGRETLCTVDSMPSTIFNIGDYAFKNCISLTKVSLSSGLTNLGKSAFEGCTALESITIPTGVTVIKPYTFLNCTSLESVTLPSTVTEIQTGAFQNCTSLKSITIPSGVTYLPSECFGNCTSLETVIIPASVTKADLWAFENCKNIKDVYFSGTASEYESLDIKIYNNSEVKIHFLYCITAAGEHTYGEGVTVTYPDCMKEGVKEFTCKNCGYVKKDTIAINPDRHINGVWTTIKSPTCTEKGQQYYDCACGNYENYRDLSALGHDYSYYTTDPTCTEDGVRYVSCIRCDYYETYDLGNAKGHKDDDHNGKCDACKYDFTANCKHLCHKGGFLYKFCLFFWKLFKIQKECSCGLYHY